MNSPPMPWLRAVCLAAVLILDVGTARPAEPGPLTLEEAVRLALANEEAVLLAGKDLEQARLERSKALKSVFPDLAFSSAWEYGRRQNEPGSTGTTEGSWRYTFSLNQPLYTGGRASSAVRSAGRVISINRLLLDRSREEVYLSAVRAYLDVLAAGKVLEASEQAVAQAREFLAMARARFELGEATRTSTLRAELELARRESERVGAANLLAVARENLRKLTGRDFSTLVEADMPSPASPGELEALVGQSLLRRRELLVAGERLAIAEEGLVFARGRFLPVFYANGYYTKGGGHFPPDETENWGTSLSLDFPIYDRGQSAGDLALARLAVEKARLEVEGLKKAVRLEVERKYYRLADLLALVPSLRKQVELAEENARGVRRQYEVGLSTDLEVATALTDLLAARVLLVRGEYDLKVAGLELAGAAGSLAVPE